MLTAARGVTPPDRPLRLSERFTAIVRSAAGDSAPFGRAASAPSHGVVIDVGVSKPPSEPLKLDRRNSMP